MQPAKGQISTAGPLPEPQKSPLRRLLPVGAVAAVLVIAWATGWLDRISLSAIIANREWLASLVSGHFAVALVIYMLLYAGLVAVSFPGASLLTIAAGFLFGGIAGGAATVFAATAGAGAIFLIARTGAGDLLAKRAGGFAARMSEGFNRNAFSYLLTIRLMPIFPFWVVNIVPALLGMRLGPYLGATFLGIIPGTFAYAYVGSGLDSIVAAQELADPGCALSRSCHFDFASLLTPQILAAMFALAAISILPVIFRRFRKSA